MGKNKEHVTYQNAYRNRIFTSLALKTYKLTKRSRELGIQTEQTSKLSYKVGSRSKDHSSALPPSNQ